MPNFYQDDENKALWLTKLGLTYTQARVYTFLDTYNAAQAKNLTTSLKLPKQDVYKALNELYEMGLIEKALTKPMIYRAIPAQKCLAILSEHRKKKYFEIEKAAKKAFFTNSKKIVLQKNIPIAQSALALKKEAILVETKTLIEKTKDNICVISPNIKLFPWLSGDGKCLKRALLRKVKIQMITNRQNTKSQNILEKLSANPLFEIKYLDNSPNASFGIYDGKIMIFELTALNGFLESETLIINNPCLVNIAATYFQFMYKEISNR